MISAAASRPSPTCAGCRAHDQDRRLVIARIGQSREDEIIIKAIIDLSHALGKRVVAEGVETQTQLAFLQTQGCDEAQGFLFCPPMPVRAVETWRAGTVPAAELQPDDQPFTSTRAETRCAVGT